MDSALGNVKAEIVGSSIDESRLNSSARHPKRENAAVMIAAIRVWLRRTLAVRRAPDLSTPNHQRVFQQTRAVSNPAPYSRCWIGGHMYQGSSA
jgi:hypothetical protein